MMHILNTLHQRRSESKDDSVDDNNLKSPETRPFDNESIKEIFEGPESILNESSLEGGIDDENDRLQEAIRFNFNRIMYSDSENTEASGDETENPSGIDYFGGTSIHSNKGGDEDSWLPSFIPFTWNPPTEDIIENVANKEDHKIGAVDEENENEKLESRENMNNCNENDFVEVEVLENNEDKKSPEETTFETMNNCDVIEIEDEEDLLVECDASPPEPRRPFETNDISSYSLNDDHVDIIEKEHPVPPPSMNFLKKFASSSGKLTRDELEELLTAKIVEVFLCSSENEKLQEGRLENQKIIESTRAWIQNMKKQYSDLEFSHNQLLMKLKEHPNVPEGPAKITHDVGIQVYPFYHQKRKLTESPAELENSESLVDDPKRRKIEKLSKETQTESELFKSRDDPTSNEEVSMNSSNDDQPETTIRRRMSTSNIPTRVSYARKSTRPSILTSEETPAQISSNIMKKRSVMLKNQLVNDQPTNRNNRNTKLPPQLLNPPQPSKPGYRKIPNRPNVQIKKKDSKKGEVILSWNIKDYDINIFAKIRDYEVYAYKNEDVRPSVKKWKKVQFVKTSSPMAVKLKGKFDGKISTQISKCIY